MRSTVVLISLAASTVATAQDAERRDARTADSEIVREIERGTYIKANIGSTIYVNGAASYGVSGVAATGVSLGGDVIDRERFSAAWEIQLTQALFQGPKVGQLQAGIPLQGDLHTLVAAATFEASGYLTRRFGIGIRGGGGVLVAPLLIEANAWQQDILPILAVTTVHDGPLPVVIAGPTLEYYTKLSHFSLGVDVDVSMVIGFDVGIYPSGYLKYTF